MARRTPGQRPKRRYEPERGDVAMEPRWSASSLLALAGVVPLSLVEGLAAARPPDPRREISASSGGNEITTGTTSANRDLVPISREPESAGSKSRGDEAVAFLPAPNVGYSTVLGGLASVQDDRPWKASPQTPAGSGKNGGSGGTGGMGGSSNTGTSANARSLAQPAEAGGVGGGGTGIVSNNGGTSGVSAAQHPVANPQSRGSQPRSRPDDFSRTRDTARRDARVAPEHPLENRPDRHPIVGRSPQTDHTPPTRPSPRDFPDKRQLSAWDRAIRRRQVGPEADDSASPSPDVGPKCRKRDWW